MSVYANADQPRLIHQHGNFIHIFTTVASISIPQKMYMLFIKLKLQLKLVLGRIRMCLRISDPDLSTRICRFYNYVPRAKDPDLYSRKVKS